MFLDIIWILRIIKKGNCSWLKVLILVKAVEDINNSTYADVGWYPDYIQTIYKPTFWLKVNYLEIITIPIIIIIIILIIIIIIIIIIMIK